MSGLEEDGAAAGAVKTPEVLCGLHITQDGQHGDDLLKWLEYHEAEGLCFSGWGPEPRWLVLDPICDWEKARNIYNCLSKTVPSDSLNVVLDRSRFYTSKVAGYRAAWIGADGEPNGCGGWVHVMDKNFLRKFPIKVVTES
jgi:hypothetical protein